MIRYSFSGLLSPSLYLSAPFFSSATTVGFTIHRENTQKERKREKKNEHALLHVAILSETATATAQFLFLAKS